MHARLHTRAARAGAHASSRARSARGVLVCPMQPSPCSLPLRRRLATAECREANRVGADAVPRLSLCLTPPAPRPRSSVPSRGASRTHRCRRMGRGSDASPTCHALRGGNT